MRPAASRLVFLLVLTLGMLAMERSAIRAQDGGGLGSDGLGVARAVWEETYGPGEPVDITSPIYHGLYVYEIENGTAYAAFEGSKSDDASVLMYLEIAFSGAGVPSDEARATAETFLPRDATIVEPYYLPPTPGAPSALSAFRYESDALATVPYGTDRLGAGILVIYVEQVAETRISSAVDASINYETTVSRLSLVAAIPTG